MTQKPNKQDEYSRLYKMIVTGQIMPNERIVEMDYAKLFECNRANIRHALARLEQDGLVVIEPRKGARVRKFTPQQAVEAYEVRGALETMLVAYAARYATPEDAENFTGILAGMATALENSDLMRVGAYGRKLREEFWRISRHETAARMLRQINSQLIRVSYRPVMMPGRAPAMMAELGEVAEAVGRNEEARAQAAMTKYHDSARKALIQALEMQDSVY